MSTSLPSQLGYRPCVGMMVFNHAGHVWIGRRSEAKNKPTGAGAWWQMPQGGIDEGEDPRAAALRELREETGMISVKVIAETAGWHTYDLPPELLGKVWGGRFKGQKQRWFALRFLGEDSEINITPPDPKDIEFDMWKWAPAGELVDLIIPFKRQVYQAVVAEFADLARPIS